MTPQGTITRKPAPIVRLGGSVALQNPWLRVDVDDVVFPDGKPSQYSVATNGTGIGVVAIPWVQSNGEDYFAFVDQYRYPIKADSLELPCGGSDNFSAEEAGRELTEETGLAMLRPVFLGLMHPDTGVLSTEVAVWLTPQPEDVLHSEFHEDESGAILSWHSRAEVRHLIKAGRIKSGVTLSALMMLEIYGVLPVWA